MACAAIPVGADEMPHDADWQVECEGKPLRLTALRTQDGGTCWFASFESVGGRRVRVTAPDGTVETTFPMRPFRRVIDSNGGTFYGNDYGIEDIGKSQSSYCGVSAVSNRVCGISLVGGARIIRESAACGNGKAEVEVRNQSRRADYYDAKDPFYRAKVLLELVRIGSGGESSLDVGEGACVTLQRCSVGGMKRIAPSAEVVFLESVEQEGLGVSDRFGLWYNTTIKL